MLDPGHGGNKPGAIGPTGLVEGDVNLLQMLLLAAKLRAQGFETNATRQDAGGISLAARCQKATWWKADLFVSLHCDGSEDEKASGYSVWTSPGETASDAVATAILESFKERFPARRGRFDYCDGDPDKESKFWVLVHTPMAAVLVEPAFISNGFEEDELRSMEFLDAVTGAIAEGITRYFSAVVAEKKAPTGGDAGPS